MELGKVPPHDVEAEQAVLGCMLTDRDSVLSAIEVLRKDSFYREDNKMIFEAIVNLYSKSQPIDVITVKAELSDMGNLERVGGLEYIAGLTEKFTTSANIDKYIRIVDDKATHRSLIQTANELVALGYDETEDVDKIMDMAEKRVFDLSSKKNTNGYSPIKDVLLESYGKLEELYNAKGKLSGLTTGFIDLDSKTSGLHNSDLVIVAARPAMGKSAFAINLATNVALKAKKGVVIFSLEMSKEQIGNRILCSEAMVDSNKLRTGMLEDDDWAKLAENLGRLSDAPIFIDDTAGISIMEIRAKARKLHIEKDIGLIVIDYLQLIQGSGNRNSSREQEISEISRSLKILAKELNVPVIALSQLSRSVEKRDDKRPMLSDLRESGAIEQDADIVMFLYRDDYYHPDTEKKNISEIILAKHRGGSTGTVDLAWLPSYTKFANLTKDNFEL
ncbi:MAG: replicative DNA helicase [Clostridia bacterium]|nr:replicative DNA helicase [Clostridia bacterium]